MNNKAAWEQERIAARTLVVTSAPWFFTPPQSEATRPALSSAPVQALQDRSAKMRADDLTQQCSDVVSRSQEIDQRVKALIEGTLSLDQQTVFNTWMGKDKDVIRRNEKVLHYYFHFLLWDVLVNSATFEKNKNQEKLKEALLALERAVVEFPQIYEAAGHNKKTITIFLNQTAELTKCLQNLAEKDWNDATTVATFRRMLATFQNNYQTPHGDWFSIPQDLLAGLILGVCFAPAAALIPFLLPALLSASAMATAALVAAVLVIAVSAVIGAYVGYIEYDTSLNHSKQCSAEITRFADTITEVIPASALVPSF